MAVSNKLGVDFGFPVDISGELDVDLEISVKLGPAFVLGEEVGNAVGLYVD